MLSCVGVCCMRRKIAARHSVGAWLVLTDAFACRACLVCLYAALPCGASTRSSKSFASLPRNCNHQVPSTSARTARQLALTPKAQQVLLSCRRASPHPRSCRACCSTSLVLKLHAVAALLQHLSRTARCCSTVAALVWYSHCTLLQHCCSASDTRTARRALELSCQQRSCGEFAAALVSHMFWDKRGRCRWCVAEGQSVTNLSHTCAACNRKLVGSAGALGTVAAKPRQRLHSVGHGERAAQGMGGRVGAAWPRHPTPHAPNTRALVGAAAAHAARGWNCSGRALART